ncbi:MAG: hypothetical protein JNM90_16995, partial [Burkholderiales bacterium]|nr:hypothetical protein [Burkholderiales bacterium]
LCMALIDEADVVLLDEARVPLVLSQPAPALAPDLLAGALACARALRRGRDFTLGEDRLPRLTDDGRALVAAWRPAGAMPSRQREDLVAQALAALHLYSRDRDYVVRDGTVAIVDAASGRIAAGRVWSRGLHQLIELKEGCPPSARNTTAAQITYQRFFRRYLRLGGMSGTLAGAEAELAATYGMAMVRIAPRLPSRRRLQQRTLYADAAALWPAMARRAAVLHRAGRPLLIGTATVADSDAAARALAAIGLPHVVLNARHDQAEADVVARAGEPARITVATSMAGRGTDIRLAADAAARGGLHVILCQHNAARRIDRQFIGRTARNGEPGSHDTLLSLDMPLFRRYLPRWWRALAARRRPAPAWFARLTIAVPQWLEERRHRALRRQLLRADLRRERDLDFCRRTAS